MEHLILINGSYYFENHLNETVKMKILNIYKHLKNPSEEHQIIYSGNNGELINEEIQEKFSIDSANTKHIKHFSSEYEAEIDEYEAEMLEKIISSFEDKKILTIVSNSQRINYFISLFQKKYDSRNIDAFREFKVCVRQGNIRKNHHNGEPITMRDDMFKDIYIPREFEGIHYNLVDKTHRTIPRKKVSYSSDVIVCH